MSKLLNNVNSPKDIKSFDLSELERLSAEIRELILDVVLEKGGHLSSNLGVVELTVALHYVFDFSKDRLILDVGHQCYAHKILTGRKDNFASLRSYGGISGFPKRQESIYDAADTGHSSTSASLACGMLRYGHDGAQIVALIGDGAMTGGLIYEAFNDVKTIGKKFIAVINNNDMSISKNVGSVAEYLRDLDSVRQPFREYGIKYYGSVDGHNLEDLIKAFTYARDSKNSIIINVHTQKGKGYAEAEKYPDKYHSYSPAKAAGDSFGSRMGKKLLQLAKKDGRIFAITAAMADGTGLSVVRNELASQFVDVGIAEEHALCMASGMAVSGAKPYVAVYSSFLQRAYDQLIHDICLNDCAVTLCIDRAGFVGGDGETHQGVYDLSYLRTMKGMTIFSPKDLEELDAVLEWSAGFEHPLAIRYPKYVPVHKYSTHEKIELSRWEWLKKDGEDVVVLACGAVMNDLAMSLHEKKGGFDIVNARFVRPMDEEILNKIKDKKIITLEDNVLSGGFGSGVAEYYLSKGMRVPEMICKAVDESKLTHATLSRLMELCGFTEEALSKDIDNLKRK